MINLQQIDALRMRVGEILSDKRFSHTLGVERMACEMGEKYIPEYVPELRIAALLHDITKEKNKDEQLRIFDDFGIILSDKEKMMPRIFHAWTAALIVKRDFREFATDKVVSAIRKHTTGEEKMSTFDKIIYLADYIEDTRTHDSCVKLRKMYLDGIDRCKSEEEKLIFLDKLMLESFDTTIKHLLDSGAMVAENTFKARNEIVFEGLGRNRT